MRRTASVQDLLKRREKLWDEVCATATFVRGSLIETRRPPVKDARGRTKRYTLRFLSRSVGGRSRSTYVAEVDVPAFAGAIVAWQRLQQTLDEISEINVALLKQQS